MRISRTWSLVVGAILVAAFVFMVEHATRGRDWPGWDEGWLVVTFPLGIPVAVAAGVGVSRRRSAAPVVAAVTAAVWSWGAILFLAWIAIA